MRKAINKDFFREIRFTLNRYLSILSIVALGVAFFAGIRATCPDMKLTMDYYLDQTDFMDIRVLSTLGLTDDDVAAINNIEGVHAVEGAYSYDAWVLQGDERQTLRFLSEPDQINRMDIVDGREIEGAEECVIDKLLVDKYGYEIGDTLTITSASQDENLFDTLKSDTYQVVGVATSSSYFATSRDTTSIGNGQTDAFVYLPKEAFSAKAYSAIYVLVDGAREKTAFSKQYEAVVEAVTDRLEAIADEREAARYDGIMADAREELDKAKKELTDAKADAEAELGKAWGEIVDGELDLASGRRELDDSKKTYNQFVSDAKKKLDDNEKQLKEAGAQITENEKKLTDGRTQLSDGEKMLKQSEAELVSGKADYEKQLKIVNDSQAQLDSGYKQLQTATASLDASEQELIGQKGVLLEQQAGLQKNLTALQDAKNQMTQALAALTAQREALLGADDHEGNKELIAQLEAQIVELQGQLAGVEANIQQVQQGIAELQTGLDQINGGLQQIADGRAELRGQKAVLDQKQAELTAGLKQLTAAKAQLDAGEAEIAAGWAEIDSQRQQLEAGQKELDAAKKQVADGQSQLEAGRKQLTEQSSKAEKQFADAEKQLVDGEKELNNGKAEYESGKQEADEKIADAEKEIADAEAELADVDYPEWYVLDRNSTQGYAEFEQNAERIYAIGKVFPLIFFLVAALMSLTTMTRMVESQRTEIGTLKALGYGNWAIARKYVFYALSASTIGSVIGLLFGQKFIPWIIITTYKVLYPNLPVVLTPLNALYSIMASAVAVLCVTGAALVSCYGELVSAAADLMRPVAPKVGKKIWLEHIGFIWKNLGFTSKVAMRNLFRYKKRFFMTVFGIGGCTAMVVFGFGLTDSISGVVARQYEELFHYDITMTLNEHASDEERQRLFDYLDNSAAINVEQYMQVRAKSMEVTANRANYMATLTVPEYADRYSDFVHFQDRETGKQYALDDDTVIITEKLAELFDLEPGDSFMIEDGNIRNEVIVGHIAENYLMNFVYMSPVLYEKTFGDAPKWNTVEAFIPGMDQSNSESFSTELLKFKAVSGVRTTDYTREKFDEALGSLDVITLIVVTAAGMLAFIVLYNLNNINITERRREMATIKVLGFYDLEVAAYVYRENILLTLIGALLGIVFGKYLHGFIITTVETDMIMFIRHAKVSSYIYAVLLTFGFSMFINWIMYYRLKKIDMVESLKSVE